MIAHFYFELVSFMENFQGMEEKYIKINGISIHIMIIGVGEPLILLHGFPDFWYGWKNVINELKDDFTLIIPDMRGYNKSDKPEGVENYDIDILVDDIKALCEYLKLEKINIAGHDWGGIVAWVFAEQHPSLLDKLIILNAPHPKIFHETILNDKKQRRASSYVFQFQTEGGEQFLIDNNYQVLELTIFGTIRNKKSFTENDKDLYHEAWAQPNAIISGVNYYKAFAKGHRGSGIITVPTLILWGMKDIYLLPIQLENLPKYVNNLKIIKSEIASHWIMHDDSALVIKEIREFIKK